MNVMPLGDKTTWEECRVGGKEERVSVTERGWKRGGVSRGGGG